MPASASMMIEKLLLIATFDIIECEVAFGWLVDFPEEDDNLILGNYNDSGYESAYTINLLGTGFIFIVVLCLTMIALLLAWPFTKISKWCEKVHASFSGVIFW